MMKYLKMWGLSLAMAAAMALSGAPPASATTLTSPKGSLYQGEFDMTSTGSQVFGSGSPTFTCTEMRTGGKFEGSVAKISTYDWSGCTFGGPIFMLQNGSLEVVSNGDGTGTVKGSGTEFTLQNVGIPGTTCVYGLGSGTVIGTLSGGNPATLAVSASLPRISGSFFCPNPMPWKGSFAVTRPSALFID